MEGLEKLVLKLHMKIVSQDQVLEGAQQAVEGWSAHQTQWLEQMGKLQQTLSSQETARTWKEHDDQKTWDLATEREKTLNAVIQQEVTAWVQDRVDAQHHFEKLSQQVAKLKAQVLENKVENTELKVQLASLARLNENQATIERFPAASSSSRMVQPEENPRVSR